MNPISPLEKGRKVTEEPTLLKQAFLAIQEMQAKLDAAERRITEPIAVVGMGCRLPGGVVDGESFWTLLREGRDAVTRVPADRWDADAYYDPDPDEPGKMVTRQGGFLDRVDGFDARFFEIAPREAAGMDPQQRLALEVAWETLENAGYAPANLRGTKTGVFLGIANSDYGQLHFQANDPTLLDAHYASGVAHSIASGRISYVLGLEGPSVSLDTACSSSLVAVHLACQSLRTGDCTMALAGGVNLMLVPETTALLSRVHMLSPDGRCRAFDESANGFVRGEGCGFVALKTLAQARMDGDRVLAVLRGTAINQDGASSSLTAPNGPSQEALMRQALANGGVLAEEVSYVEAHGTGTALGDPIELQALGGVYGAARAQGETLIVGSLKTNVGHLESAAGIAGLIKVLLSLQHRQIAPHLHFERPTSHVRWDALRLAVPRKLMDWEGSQGTGKDKRIAAVSSFGFSGTNAHIVIAEAEPADTTRDEANWPVQLLAVSAKSDTALKALVGQYQHYLEEHPADLRDLCFTANTGRSHFSHRACFVAADAAEMRAQLAAFNVYPRTNSPSADRVCFLFTGQGSQYVGMGRELYASSAVFRAGIDRCAAAWLAETGESLIEVLYPAAGAASRMGEARCAQPALFAFEYAMAELWRSWGVEPGVVLGHSLGEYVAAVVAGVWSVEDGLKLVCARARLMDGLTAPGAMRSIVASVARVERAIAGLEGEVAIAAVNGPESVVISGAAAVVTRVAEELEAEGIRTRALEVTHGFHSPLLEPILEEFEACARQVTYHAPRIRMISNLTGRAAGAGEVATAAYWRNHMRQAVLFDAGLKTALDAGCTTFLEVGPQPHLLSLGKLTHTDSALAWLPSVRRGRSGWLDLLSSVQALYERGAEIGWKALQGRSGRPIELPTYPFDRVRHWLPKRAVQGALSSTPESGQRHPLLGARLRSPLDEIQFASRIGPDEPAYLGDHAVGGRRIVPAAAYLEMALAAAQSIGDAQGDRAQDRSTAIRGVTFLRPCIFDEPQSMYSVFRPTESGSSFTIHSCSALSADADTEWTLHVSGEIGTGTAADALSGGSQEDLEAIRTRCTEESDSSAFYRMFEEHGSCFGARFRPIARIVRAPGEALVEFAMPAEVTENADLYQIHPIALDGCFQALTAVVSLSTEDSGTIYLPAALDELRLLGDPRRLAVAHARIRNTGHGHGGSGESPAADVLADVVGFDRSGNVLVSARGLAMRPVRQQAGDTTKADPIADSFYEVDWVPHEEGSSQAGLLPTAPAATAPAFDGHGTWVLFSGAGDVGRSLSVSLAASLTRSDRAWVRIEQEGSTRGDVFAASGEVQLSFDPASPAGYESVLQAIGQQASAPISDFVYVAHDAADDGLRLHPERLMALEAETLGRCLQLSQALLRINLAKTPRLWIVTKGAQGPSLANISQSTLWGFGRAVAAEHSEMRVVRIDLDPARETDGEELMHAMRTAGAEDELVLRGREVYVPRLRPAAQRASLPDSDSGSGAALDDANVRLTLATQGTLDGMELVAGTRVAPKPGEVEIRVVAAGLNFRDVLNVLGMYKGKTGPLGGECAGVVVRVGEGVTSLQPGDEVLAIGQGCFARFLTTRAEMAWRKPARLSFEAAVTVPVTFLTAVYALESIAAIKAGDSVLIHAGTGGVGLAAIQVAQRAGAIVFATAGSVEKRAYLRSIGVHHVMDSRSLDFAGETLALTQGRGVDVVLNSLAGSFIDAGFQTLAPGGRFLELGVADIRSQEWSASLRPDVTYHPVNLAPALEAGDSLVREMLATIFDQVQAGALQPLPRAIFSLENAHDAFRYMAKASHIGRVVLCPAKQTDREMIRKDAAYLVTGGLSGLGLAVAEWLGQSGAAQVLVMGRRPPTADAVELFRTMRGAGTVVTVCQGDVSSEADVATALGYAGAYPLRGVFHCAGVLDDGALLQQDWTRFQRTLAPKLDGVWALHRLTADAPLDHFVLFSSVASVLGSPGQTNYAAANAFLDAMAQYRHNHGLPALSINWGAWGETGAAVRHDVVQRGAKIGLRAMSTRDGLKMLEVLLADSRAQVMAASVDWKMYFANSDALPQQKLLSELRSARKVRTSVTATRPKNPSWLPQLETAAPVRRPYLLAQLIAERIQVTLGLSPAQELDPEQPLQELGLDSLLSIELRNSLGASLNCTLPATLLFNYSTLAALTGFLSRDILGEANPKPAERKIDPQQTNLVEDIEALSDEEVDRLLSARAMGGIQ
jgi:acyl transferase domain-containing protein/NADPH:quinone reductase-like Zn-dependent oxidoreductase/NADP-dependent 3-hydroxy acid dehydrogenase YdfG/acyl carrier protein